MKNQKQKEKKSKNIPNDFYFLINVKGNSDNVARRKKKVVRQQVKG